MIDEYALSKRNVPSIMAPIYSLDDVSNLELLENELRTGVKHNFGVFGFTAKSHAVEWMANQLRKHREKRDQEEQ